VPVDGLPVKGRREGAAAVHVVPDAVDDVGRVRQVVGDIVFLERVGPVPPAIGIGLSVFQQDPHHAVGGLLNPGLQPPVGNVMAEALHLTGQVGGRVEAVVAQVVRIERVGEQPGGRGEPAVQVRSEGAGDRCDDPFLGRGEIAVRPVEQGVDDDPCGDRVFCVGRVGGAVAVGIPREGKTPSDDAVAVFVAVIQQPLAGGADERAVALRERAGPQPVELRGENHGVGLGDVGDGVAGVVRLPPAGMGGGDPSEQI